MNVHRRLLRARSRDDELRRVYREHVAQVFAFFAYSVPRDIAEDLTASTFERVIRAWASFDRNRGSEAAWILGIARNLQTDYFRRAQHRVGPSLDEHPHIGERVSDDNTAEDRLLAEDSFRFLVSKLPARDREVLALRFAGDLQGHEIAGVTGLSTANVHQILSRSLKRLRRELEADVASDRS